MNSFCYYSNR